MNEKINQYWQDYLTNTHQSSRQKCQEDFYFGDNPEMAEQLLQLVLKGVKTATTSLVYEYELENDPFPQVGERSIVTDYVGNPYCIIETKQILKMKFKDMTFDICRREGEDENLDSWRANHITFFSKIGEQLGFKFNEDMEIIFEDFEVIYK